MLPAVSGSAPCPQDPGHGGIQGAGVSGVGFGVRSVGSGRAPVCRTCVKRGSSSRIMSGSSAGRSRVKMSGSSSD